jgi:hypothetical protein
MYLGALSRQYGAALVTDGQGIAPAAVDDAAATRGSRFAALSIAIPFAICALLLFIFVPWAQNADDLLPTMVSLQKLTVYFWGQNRFANLLPLLTVWIRSPVLNAEAQLVLRVAFGLLAPAFFSGLFYRRWTDVLCATLAADCLVLIAASPAFIHETYIVATPYGTALACAAIGMALVREEGQGASSWRLALTGLVGVLLMLTAYLVNFSLWMTSVPLIGSLALLVPTPERTRLLLLNAMMALAGFSAPMVLAPAYQTRLTLVAPLSGFAPFAAAVWAGTGWVFLGCVAVPVAAACLMTTVRRGWFVRFNGLIALSTVALFAAAASSTHVALNDYHMRYFVPALIGLMAAGGIGCWEVARTFLTRSAWRTIAVLSVALILAGVRLAGSGGATPDIIKPDEAAPARAVAARVAALGLDGIAGNYWHVWPAVFAAEQLRHETGGTRPDIMGITQRGEARRDIFLARLAAKGSLRLACIDFAMERCLEEVRVVMDPPPTRIHEFAPSEPLPLGRTLRFVEIAPEN